MCIASGWGAAAQRAAAGGAKGSTRPAPRDAGLHPHPHGPCNPWEVGPTLHVERPRERACAGPPSTHARDLNASTSPSLVCGIRPTHLNRVRRPAQGDDHVVSMGILHQGGKGRHRGGWPGEGGWAVRAARVIHAQCAHGCQPCAGPAP